MKENLSKLLLHDYNFYLSFFHKEFRSHKRETVPCSYMSNITDILFNPLGLGTWTEPCSFFVFCFLFTQMVPCVQESIIRSFFGLCEYLPQHEIHSKNELSSWVLSISLGHSPQTCLNKIVISPFLQLSFTMNLIFVLTLILTKFMLFKQVLFQPTITFVITLFNSWSDIHQWES